MKVAILPADEGRFGGVVGVTYALRRHLPSFGIEIVEPEKADIVHVHAVAQWQNPDVATSHGIYPIPVDYPWQKRLNDIVLNNLMFGKVVTSPSLWATKQYAYLGRDVKVIPNGVDMEEHIPGEPQGYVLFGKTASYDGIVKDGLAIAQWVATQLPKQKFVFINWEGAPPSNVSVVGPQKYEDMRILIRNASAYLATTWENHSLQVLEAMASGVPIVGMKWGGTAETIPNDDCGGILAEQLKDLPEIVNKVLANRSKLSLAAREWVSAHYQWQDIMPLYIAAYKEAWAIKNQKPGLTASIVITCHNLEKYIDETIQSALAQRFDSFEVIVVDDGSTDNSWDLVQQYHERIRSYRRDTGHGAGDARNYGVARATGKYICCLDGDDRMHPNFLQYLVPILEVNPWTGIAYSPFTVFGEQTGTWAGQPWNFSKLIDGNYIGNCSLFRKEAWRRVGGYKDINPSWEDYDFWLSIGEAGYFGEMYPQPLWDYRMKPDGRNVDSQSQVPRLRATVNAYHPRLYRPTVSVIIPCYNQEKYLVEAVTSVLEQTYQDYEIIVVDDGSPGDVLKALEPFANEPRVRLLRQENKGLAAARNAGINVARGTYVLPLDADDKLDPDFLTQCLAEMRRGDGIIYTDFVAFRDDGSSSKHELPEYDFNRMLNESGIMFCASLFPRQMWLEVGGYPEDMTLGWEDYAFWIAAGVKGWQGRRVPYYGFWYRQHEKSMRLSAWENRTAIQKQLAQKFGLVYLIHPKDKHAN